MSDRLTILTYHAIDHRNSVISVTPDLFRRQMRLMAEKNFVGICLADAFACFDRSGHFPERSVVLTFDDGYVSVYEEALPVMKTLGFTATAFISTDFVGQKAEQAKRLNADIDRDVMDWNQIRHLEDEGWEIGAHSMGHPDLPSLAAEQLEGELVGSKDRLQAHLQRPVQSFAYPYGIYNENTRKAVSGHYRRACTTVLAHNRPKQNPLLLNRLDVYYLERDRIFVKACEGRLQLWWWIRQAIRDTRAYLR